MNNDNRLQILKENYKNHEQDLSFVEWFEMEAENDPKFFNWFFGSEAENIGDFGLGMTNDQQLEYDIFISNYIYN